MRIPSFTLLAVLSYVAMIGATPLEARAPPTEVLDPRQLPDCSDGSNDEICSAICESDFELFFPFCYDFCVVNSQFAVCANACNFLPSETPFCSD
ncbi:hypothetical protein BGY98DRAFT_992492 [Russula aff. rugulosa BPL654]|nr:hypothetical protein BGY98DRAFT_1101449 [Russula aff. rugulosa BPL654]KAI0275530.1 hypothetical protein BGY98DRAFT_992492 [Russula aff. rugulosa BPL654]